MFIVCLEFDVQEDVETGQACIEVCICYHCYVLVRGPPVGTENEEGFDVGKQALGNLHAGARFTACLQQNLLLLTFKQGGSTAQATDVLTAGNSS